MSVPVGILVFLALTSLGVIANGIESDGLIETEKDIMDLNNDNIQSRDDYHDPDFDDLNSFFDFEIAPPSITYQHLDDSKPKKSHSSRFHINKNYYHYDSDGRPVYKSHQFHPSPTKKQIVTPGSTYKASTEKTFIEEDDKESNETKPFLQQAKIGNYQVSIVDANSPLLSELGLTLEDLEKLSGHNKHSLTNASMIASDSTASATYAENPHPNSQPAYSPPQQPSYPPQQQSSYPSPQQPGQPPYPPSYDSASHSPHRAAPGERRQSGYSQPSSVNNSPPPPQGSYDPKSYRAVPSGYTQISSNHYHPASYNNPAPHGTYSQPPSSYSNPPASTSYGHSQSYANQSPYSHAPSQSTYSPQRNSDPWRQSSHVHVDWDDKQTKQHESWKSNNYPPHPPPLPYSSSSGSYHSKPTYGPAPDKNGHRLAATYQKPESMVKPSYSTSGSSTGHSSYKPGYHAPPTYSSPSPSGSVNYAASSHYEHPAPASKPGITIRFKSKAPSSHGSHGGVNIPLSFSPLEIVKKILPSLNPLNNKKVTIGITIENKKDHPHEIHAY